MARKTFALATGLLVGVAGMVAAEGQPESGAGEGFASFQGYCRLCHRVPADLGRERPYSQWRKTVARMSGHLTNIKREEIPVSSQILIARYLEDRP